MNNEKERNIIGLPHRYIVFIDETGDPTFHKNLSIYDDPSVFPIMTVTALIIPRITYRDITMLQIDNLKQEFFNSKEIYFHSREIRRKDGIYKIFLDKDFYQDFKNKIDGIIEKSSMQIISCSIDKRKLLKRAIDFKNKNGTEYNIGDLYLKNVDYILERLGHFLRNKTAKIIFETRGKKESKRIQGVLTNAKEKGTFYCKTKQFQGIDKDILFLTKQDNINGLQLVDYCTYSFARHTKNNNDKDNLFFNFLRKYIYNGDYGEYGLKEWP